MSNVPPPPPGSTPPPPPPGGPAGTAPPPPPAYPPAGGAPPPPPAYGQPPSTVTPQFAGFGIRLGAYLLDGLLYGLATVPFMIAGFILIGIGLDDCVTINDDIYCNGQEKVGPIVGGAALMALGAIVVIFLYLRALATSGQTWGCKIVNIKVVRTDNGMAPGWGKAIGRSLFSYISAWVFYLGYLWMIWDRDKQTWQDKVAGTYVVRA